MVDGQATLRREADLWTLEDTCRLGAEVSSHLFAGSVVALTGPLGAGKTTLTRAISQGLGVDPRMVSSPTFGLVHEYVGTVPVYHLDVYRLNHGDDVAALGLEELLGGDGICLIEWAERIQSYLPHQRLDIELQHVEGRRRAILTGHGLKYASLFKTAR